MRLQNKRFIVQLFLAFKVFAKWARMLRQLSCLGARSCLLCCLRRLAVTACTADRADGVGCAVQYIFYSPLPSSSASSPLSQQEDAGQRERPLRREVAPALRADLVG